MRKWGDGMGFFIYGNSGGIDKVMQELRNPKETFGSLTELFEAIKDKRGAMFDIKDLNIIYYCYDPRIDKEVYMITTNRYGEEDYIRLYGNPQFLYFLIEV